MLPEVLNGGIVVIDGDCALTFSGLDGEAVAVLRVREVDPYKGPYSFTPSQEAQTIAITGLTPARDITIEPIPSNYGLVTWNGSTLTVS